MEGSENKKEKAAPKRSNDSYKVLIGFDLEGDIRCDEGSTVTGLTTKQVESLIKMNAIAKEKQ